jgi:hypothetical protein
VTQINLIPGVTSDIPWATPFGAMKANRGLNMRWRNGAMETLGFHGALRDISGAAVTVPVISGVPARALYTAQYGSGIQILAGGLNRIDLIDVNSSMPPGDTRYKITQLGTTLTPTASDALPNPTLKRIVIPPTWWFSEQMNTIVGMRAGVNEPVRFWDRNPANAFVSIPAYAPGDPAGTPSLLAPSKAVGGAIFNGVLILFGCDPQFGAPGDELMTVRWSNRLNFSMWDATIDIDQVTLQANRSGGLTLERGSRIVGGGFTTFGPMAWTDKAAVLFTEVDDIALVFARTYIDGGSGLLANRAWCDAGGQVFWLDESRTLNVFDGSRPRAITNPMRKGTIDRVNEIGAARIYMTPNPEYGEIIISYPADGSTECNRQIVYNYVEDAWSIWGLSRTHWFPRQGLQEAVAIAPNGVVYAHDIGPSVPNVYLPDNLPPLPPNGSTIEVTGVIGASNIEAITGFVEFGPMVTNEAAAETFDGVSLFLAWLASPAFGAEGDTIDVAVVGYADGDVSDPAFHETLAWEQGDTRKKYRVSGRSLAIRISFTDIKTVYRLGLADIEVGPSSGGDR